MEILWVLMALAMFSLVLLPVLRRRRTGIQLVSPGDPDAADPANRIPASGGAGHPYAGPDGDLLDVLDLVQRTQEYQAASQLLAGTEIWARHAGSGCRPSQAPRPLSCSSVRAG